MHGLCFLPVERSNHFLPIWFRLRHCLLMICALTNRHADSISGKSLFEYVKQQAKAWLL